MLTVLFETAMALTLPGGPPVGMDYLAYDPGSGLVWVPAGNTGRVDVVDTMTGKLTPTGQSLDISQPVCVTFVPVE